MGPGPRPAELLEIAVAVAHRAGAELRRRVSDPGVVDSKSTATDPVSEADRAAERLITAVLLDVRPDDGLLGEEGASRPGTTGLRWVVDPLDGTVNFLYGIPAWSVSIACEDEQGAVAGVVYDAPRDETWAATRGGGATLDGSALAVREPVALGRALIATGFGYVPDVRGRQAATVAALLPRVRDIRRIGSAALDLCGVAGGRTDGYFESTTSRWDWAAGALVAAEAGALVTGYGDGLVVAGPSLHAELCAAIGADPQAPLPG